LRLGWSDIAVAAVPCAALGALLLACTSPVTKGRAPEVPADSPAEPPDEENGDPDGADARVDGASSQHQLVWLSSETEALERGRDERRPVLVHFDSQWCADCKRMKQETFDDPRVKAQAGRFVAVRIDATNDEDPQVSAALQKYTVINVPTLILLDSSGHEQRRFTELVGPETLLHEIDQVR
jgi:thiol:disulfide interchange protein